MTSDSHGFSLLEFAKKAEFGNGANNFNEERSAQMRYLRSYKSNWKESDS